MKSQNSDLKASYDLCILQEQLKALKRKNELYDKVVSMMMQSGLTIDLSDEELEKFKQVQSEYNAYNIDLINQMNAGRKVPRYPDFLSFCEYQVKQITKKTKQLQNKIKLIEIRKL